MTIVLPWWIWAIAAVAIGIAELHAPGSYLIWIALGAAITAGLDAGWGLSFTAQIVTFIIASAISCGAGYFVYRHLNRRAERKDTLNQPDQRLVGRHGTVLEPIVNGQGKVRLGDSVWLAEGPNLAVGAPVKVKSVRGTCVIVEPAPSR